VNTILVVDDEVDTAELLQEILQMQGYRVLVAFDGKHALSKVTMEKPDLVVTDIMMPGLDGNELIRALQEHSATAAIPVIAMSANENVSHRPFLRKPFDVREFTDLVARCLAARC